MYTLTHRSLFGSSSDAKLLISFDSWACRAKEDRPEMMCGTARIAPLATLCRGSSKRRAASATVAELRYMQEIPSWIAARAIGTSVANAAPRATSCTGLSLLASQMQM